MLVERGIEALNVEVVGDAYAIASGRVHVPQQFRVQRFSTQVLVHFIGNHFTQQALVFFGLSS